MRIGVPKEIKIHEYRVGLVPAAVRELTAGGHQVLVQSGAGGGIDCSDEDYRSAGAGIAPDNLTVHVTNEGYVPWDLAPGAQLLLHLRWARRSESLTSTATAPAPAIRSLGHADIHVPGVVQPEGEGWRLEVTAELIGQSWAQDLGTKAHDTLRLTPDAVVGLGGLTQVR